MVEGPSKLSLEDKIQAAKTTTRALLTIAGEIIFRPGKNQAVIIENKTEIRTLGHGEFAPPGSIVIPLLEN